MENLGSLHTALHWHYIRHSIQHYIRTLYSSTYGTPYSSTCGTPYNSTYGTTYSSTYGTPYSSTCGTPYSSTCGTPYSSTYGTSYSTTYGTAIAHLPQLHYTCSSSANKLCDIYIIIIIYTFFYCSSCTTAPLAYTHHFAQKSLYKICTLDAAPLTRACACWLTIVSPSVVGFGKCTGSCYLVFLVYLYVYYVLKSVHVHFQNVNKVYIAIFLKL